MRPGLAAVATHGSQTQTRHGGGADWPGQGGLERLEMVGFPGKPRMEIYTSFLCLSGKEAVEVRLVQVEDLLDTPLSLGPLRHVVLGDEMDIFEFETVYTLFEFIEGINLF